MSTDMSENLSAFLEQLAPISYLKPRVETRKKVAQPVYTQQGVTIVGLKTTTGRFLPVSHEGYGIQTYVDKVRLLGKRRAEFGCRKLKGMERRSHMRFFRELTAIYSEQPWDVYFEQHFDRACVIPNNLCVACWNCSLFGGMEAGKHAAQARIRFFDTYSIQEAEECIAMDGSEEGMGIGNQVYEDVNKVRGSETYHQYEYVKAETIFPFITVIENPTVLDVAGYLAAIRRADIHGYGRYSANHGKFATKVLSVATGIPRFSVLDMLTWAEQGGVERHFSGTDKELLVRYDHQPRSFVLSLEEIEQLEGQLESAFREYLRILQVP
jgi:hypothetical protein